MEFFGCVVRLSKEGENTIRSDFFIGLEGENDFLFLKMKSLEHIYIQDSYAGEIKEFVINILQRINGDFQKDRIIPKTNVGQFLLPPEI